MALLGGPLGSPWGPVGVLGHAWGSLWVVLTLRGPLGRPWRSMAGAWGAWGCFAGAIGGPLEVSGGPLGDFEIVKKPSVFIEF